MHKKVLALLLIALAFSFALKVYADIKGEYAVKEVLGPDKIRIAFHGLPITVRLANIKARPEALELLKKLVAAEEVSIRYATELGLDEIGTPFVNMAVGPPLKRQIVNVELVAAGLADYDKTRAPNKTYDAQMTAALEKAKSEKLGMWGETAKEAAPPVEPAPVKETVTAAPAVKETPAENTGVVAEINANVYHLPTCSSARRLSKRNKVRYASPEAAERAGKTPCARCQKERARKAREKNKTASSGKKKWPAPLIGLKSNTKFFYTPVAPQLKDVSVDDMIGFQTVKEAKASGRKPDPISMRLTALPGYPLELPEGGECIGRALPFFRPCRRDAKGPSGLCEWCAKGE